MTKGREGQAPGQWRRLCEFTLTRKVTIDPSSKPKGKFLKKRSHANTYIKLISDILCDTSPLAGTYIYHTIYLYTSSNTSASLKPPGKENMKVLPYEDVKSFYAEYLAHCDAVLAYPTDIASESVFRRAFEGLENVKLLGCKGGFHTCEICNNANDLLRDRGDTRCVV
jgi:hypothetical protein